MIASQLPDDRAEALLVLDYARHMVVEFSNDASRVSDKLQRVSGIIENSASSAAPVATVRHLSGPAVSVGPDVMAATVIAAIDQHITHAGTRASRRR